MLILKKRTRNTARQLIPLMRWHPHNRRCYISGQSYKGQIPFPPPWAFGHRDFNAPKKYPLEIDHLNEQEWDARTENLRWVTKTYHIIKSRDRSPVRRRQPRAAPTGKPKAKLE